MRLTRLHEADKILESEWSRAGTLTGQKRIAEMGVWYTRGFTSGLRGEEMLLIELAGTANSLKYFEDPALPSYELVVLGTTKANRLSGAKFGVPCVAVTEGTNLRPGRWIK
jgi:hypothetical protein